MIRLFPAEISVCLEVKDQDTSKEIDEISERNTSWFDSQTVPELPRDDSNEHAEVPETENPLSAYSQDPNGNNKVHCQHHYVLAASYILVHPCQPPCTDLYDSLRGCTTLNGLHFPTSYFPMGRTSLSHCSQGTGICAVNKHAQSSGQ